MQIDCSLIDLFKELGLGTIIGVVIGSFLTHFFTMSRERQRIVVEQKTTAYSDFLKGFADITISQREKNERNGASALALLTGAKARTLVCGSNDVVTSLTNFFGKGGELDTPEKKSAFEAIVEAMRKDVYPGSKAIDGNTMQQLLFQHLKEDSK